MMVTVIILSLQTDRHALANSADPGQTAPPLFLEGLLRVFTVCHSICTFCTNLYFDVCDFRLFTANILGFKELRDFTVNKKSRHDSE